MDKQQLKARLEEIKKQQTLSSEESDSKKIEYPSKTQMVKNLAQSVVNNVQSLITGNGIKLSETEASQRFSICSKCEFFDALQARCTKCGCKMAIKTYLKAEKCPIGKW